MPGGMAEQVQIIIDGGATAFVAALGVPTEVIELCHRADVLVVSMCGKVDHAVRAVEAGCDLVVAQGTEAGGHTGQVATMPLVPQIVDAVGDRVPVVAAGGIFDGRGLAAALSLGADGVWVGTRFIATPEARGVLGLQGQAAGQPGGPDHRQPRLLGQDDARRPERVHRTTTTATPRSSRSSPSSSASPTAAGAMHLGGDSFSEGVDVDKECYPAGQGVGAITELVPAGELVRRFVAEAEEALDRLAGLR